MSPGTCSKQALTLVLVEPQPDYIESSGRWCWPLPLHARFPGCCTEVVTASREWWEYAPSKAKPHPLAEGVLRNGVWYWTIPEMAVEMTFETWGKLGERPSEEGWYWLWWNNPTHWQQVLSGPPRYLYPLGGSLVLTVGTYPDHQEMFDIGRAPFDDCRFVRALPPPRVEWEPESEMRRRAAQDGERAALVDDKRIRDQWDAAADAYDDAASILAAWKRGDPEPPR